MNERTALVTGANKGIGKHIARLLAAEGLTVYVGSRDPGRGQRAVEEIGAGARLLVLDVTDPDGIAQAAAQVDRLDVLVNNAGVSPSLAPPTGTGVEEYRRTYETNVFGAVAVTNAFLPALRRSPRPRIVNISSGTASLTWSTTPNPQFTPGSGAAAYRSSKAALNALTVLYAQTLAEEGFKVNALAPGLRATDLNPRAAAAGGDPAEAAQGALRLALLPDDGPTGGFFSWDGTPCPGDQPWAASGIAGVALLGFDRAPPVRFGEQHQAVARPVPTRSGPTRRRGPPARSPGTAAVGASRGAPTSSASAARPATPTGSSAPTDSTSPTPPPPPRSAWAAAATNTSTAPAGRPAAGPRPARRPEQQHVRAPSGGGLSAEGDSRRIVLLRRAQPGEQAGSFLGERPAGGVGAVGGVRALRAERVVGDVPPMGDAGAGVRLP